MKNKFRILISLLFLFFTTQSFSSPIQKINFIGLNNNSEESLLQIIPFQAGQELNDTSSNLIIESLFRTGLFSDISISKTQDNLNITLEENPTVKYFDFDLASVDGFYAWLKNEKPHLDQDTLNKLLETAQLAPGSIYNNRNFKTFSQLLNQNTSNLVTIM